MLGLRIVVREDDLARDVLSRKLLAKGDLGLEVADRMPLRRWARGMALGTPPVAARLNGPAMTNDVPRPSRAGGTMPLPKTSTSWMSKCAPGARGRPNVPLHQLGIDDTAPRRYSDQFGLADDDALGRQGLRQLHREVAVEKEEPDVEVIRDRQQELRTPEGPLAAEADRDPAAGCQDG